LSFDPYTIHVQLSTCVGALWVSKLISLSALSYVGNEHLLFLKLLASEIPLWTFAPKSLLDDLLYTKGRN
jgi:hypothetical protein